MTDEQQLQLALFSGIFHHSLVSNMVSKMGVPQNHPNESNTLARKTHGFGVLIFSEPPVNPFSMISDDLEIIWDSASW